MVLDKRQIGLLNGLMYYAQFDYPMATVAPGIYEGMLNSIRPTHPIPEVLSYIQAILAQESIPLASLLIDGKSEKEIRDYLQMLAEVIEHRNPKLIRSGQPVPQDGKWFCYENERYSVFLSKGDIAPDYESNGAVWVLDPPYLLPTAKERILRDFAENFIPDALHLLEHKDPENYAKATFKRLSVSADARMLADLSTVLNQLIQQPDAPILDEIKYVSGFDWTEDTEDDKRWTFLQKFVGGLIRRIDEKERAEKQEAKS